MSMRGAIASLAAGTYSLKQYNAGTYSLGRRTKGTLIRTVAITASIQPMSGAELKLLPEARHEEEVRVIFTTTELVVSSATRSPDIVIYGGEDWEVFKVEYWESFGESHYKGFIAKRSVA